RGGFEVAEELYQQLQAAGIEVLYDDRDESPGVKFNDADLIGIPVRLTAGKRSLDQGGVEMKLRREAERSLVPLSDVVQSVQATLDALLAEIEREMDPAGYQP